MTIPAAYELIEEREMKDIASVGYLLSHKKTKARVFIIENDDENKVFSIGFRTTPKDNTGVAHIIEHTVLCGSEKYPAKDPFVELVKGSLNTFLNAMTYPDKTVYPVASCNDKDFKNLMSVYMDAVFHPNIYRNKLLFEQEGWHYELSDKDAPLIYNGVVYNEMKGAYSSADDVLGELISKALYPDSEYSNDSGGFPEEIPSLTYGSFLDFHRKYYHPSNSFTYIYGNADMHERLDWIDKEYFSKYDYLEIDSMPKYQDGFIQAKEYKGYYGITESESEEKNTYLAWTKVMGDTSDPESCTAFGLLSTVLLDAPGAPIKQALIDAGIGEEVFGYYADSMRQPYFAIVAKGADESQKEEFVRIIEEKLKELVEEGINKKSLLAALNNLEFTTKEADFGHTPKGLVYGLDIYGYWLYDDLAVFGDMEFDQMFTSLREKIDIGYFEQIIKIMLLDNNHAATVVLAPEKGYNEKKEKELAEKLAGIKASMTDEEIEYIVKHTAELKKFQDTPSTEAELEMIPMLSRDDVKKEAAKYLNEEKQIGDTKVVTHDYFTSGIAYFAMYFDLDSFALEDVPYLALVTGFLGSVDTENFTYKDLADEMRIKMGGFGATVSNVPNNDNVKEYAVVSGKMLKDQIPESMELIKEVLFTSKYTDVKRIRELLTETKSRLATTITERGNSFAAMRCGSYFSKRSYLDDLAGGIAYYQFIENLVKNFDEKSDEIIKKLSDIAKKVYNRSKLLISFTGPEDLYEIFAKEAPVVLDAMNCEKLEPVKWDIRLEAKNEGFLTGAQVNYVSRSGNYKKANADLDYTGHLRVLRIWMGYEYLWVNVRVKGGAYGCSSMFTRKGDVTMSSFRDPNVAKTSEIFKNAAETIKKLDFSERDMTKYILGAVNELDTPLSPARKGDNAIISYLSGISFEDMQKQRDEILSANIQNLRDCAVLVDTAIKQDYICAVGNASAIEADKDIFKTVLPLFH